MATKNRKVQVESGVDATGARKGFSEIKDAAKDMAKAVTDQGQAAGKGIEKVGDGAEAAAKKVERDTKSMIAQIQRVTAAAQAGSKDSPDYFNIRAQQRGIDPKALQPYLADLEKVRVAQKAAQGTLDGMGMSAKATTAALRQLPAQFTDIVTSLQGGQQPLTVLLQQGGQLKDVFGGVGPAARALGGYVLGLVNPFTVAAAAAVGLAYAYNRGAEEDARFRRSVILTGGAAGATARELQAMAAAVNESGAGTRGRAAEIINQLAQDSAVGAGNLQRFAAAAIQLEKVGGPAAEETARAFSSLAKSPLEAALKLNEGTNFLTRSVYEQIRALEQQGRASDAATVAQNAFFEATQQRAGQVQAQLGYIERGWIGIKEAIKGAGDALLGIGREQTDPEKLAALQSQLAARRERNASIGIKDGKATQDLQDEINLLSRRMLSQREAAGAQFVLNEQLKKAAEFDKDGVQYLTRRAQLEREITRVRNEGAAAGKSPEEIEKRVAQVREKFDPGIREATIQSGVSAVQRQLGALTAAYSDAESILEAQRKAGLIDEAAYYEAKRAFVRLGQDAQVQALRDEITQLEKLSKSDKLTTAERIANGDKIRDNQSKIDQINAKAATATVLLGVQQTSALDGITRAYEEAKLAAEDYLTALVRTQQRDLDLFGAGNRARQDEQGRNQISDKYRQDRQRIQNDRALTAIQQGGTLTSDQAKQFDDLLRLNREYEEKALASYADYTERRLELEGEWQQGAGRAFRNYLEDARDIAKQTEDLLTRAFGLAEDALVQFVKTGKLDFKSLADSIISDLLRIQAKELLTKSFSFFGFSLGSLGSSAGSGGAASFDVSGLEPAAMGGVFDRFGKVHQFAAGDVFDQPTRFSFGGGRRGELGEAGPEAIMPLRRGANGKLGVQVSGGAGQQLVNQFYIGGGVTRNELAALIPEIERRIEAKVQQRQRRPGYAGAN